MRNKRLQGRVLKANQTLTPNAHYESVYDEKKVVAVARKFGLGTVTSVIPAFGDVTGITTNSTPIKLAYSSLEEYNSATKTVAVLTSIELTGPPGGSQYYIQYSLDGGTNWINGFPGYSTVSDTVPHYIYIIVYPNDYIAITVDGPSSISSTIPNLASYTGNIIRIIPGGGQQAIGYTVNYRNYKINFE